MLVFSAPRKTENNYQKQKIKRKHIKRQRKDPDWCFYLNMFFSNVFLLTCSLTFVFGSLFFTQPFSFVV